MPTMHPMLTSKVRFHLSKIADIAFLALLGLLCLVHITNKNKPSPYSTPLGEVPMAPSKFLTHTRIACFLWPWNGGVRVKEEVFLKDFMNRWAILYRKPLVDKLWYTDPTSLMFRYQLQPTFLGFTPKSALSLWATHLFLLACEPKWRDITLTVKFQRREVGHVR